jgi:hypothetical protein
MLTKSEHLAAIKLKSGIEKLRAESPLAPARCSAAAASVKDAAAIALAEMEYWKKAPDECAEQAIGAIGAASNIYAAIHGARAPWHPKPPNG